MESTPVVHAVTELESAPKWADEVEGYKNDMRDDLLTIDELHELHAVITVAEAAKQADMSKSAVLKAWHKGHFAGRMAGRTLLISDASFTRWYNKE